MPDAGIAQSSTPWWDDYPLIVQDRLEECQRMHGNVGFPNGLADPTWGIYGQRITEEPEKVRKMHAAGIKTMTYYESFGTAYNFIVELGEKGSLDYTPVKAIHWNWQAYGGGPTRWVGPQNYFDCEEFAGVYTRKHPRYGGRVMTYPDGKVATGCKNDDPSDPRNSRVLDAAVAKTILGQNIPAPSPSGNAVVNAIDPKTGKPKGPLNGLVKMNIDGKDVYVGNFIIGKDSACPMWIDILHASILYGADHGLDGIWSDNYSPWDSFSYKPVQMAFGDWSVALFRDYLKKNFPLDRLKAMGVADVNTFDVRAALRAQCKAWGGDDTNLDDPIWSDARWLDHPLWRAYMIYKRQTGTRALSAYYHAAKEAGAQAGKPDFLVSGNDIPLFSLGWARGDLDMVSTEMCSTWHMSTSRRGIMPPPLGRYSPMYKLAREHAKSRLVNVWFYIDEKEHQGKSGIAQVLEYEMLANHALPMIFPHTPTVAGNDEVNAAFFKFVGDAKPTYGRRVPIQDVGLYYSSSSILATMTPLGFRDMENQPHQFGHWGWGTALGELHYQYRPIPEWKLTPKPSSPCAP